VITPRFATASLKTTLNVLVVETPVEIVGQA
jgi:hypothetical protein